MSEDIRRAIDTIKSLALDMIDNAESGHPGIVLGAAPIMYTLFADHLKLKPDDNWVNRDRFIMSAGHGSALLYATLYLAGYPINPEELKQFRSIDSRLPGHPEYGITPGVDYTTGPLGQGFAAAVGMAMAERYVNASLTAELPKQKLVDHYTYALCGDGDLMEGISYEAASFAGTQKLNKLIVLYDSNDVTLDGKTETSFTENVRERFKAMGWHTDFVKDGEDVRAISKAIDGAKRADAPSLIEVKTIIGNGSKDAGKNIVHGKPLEKNDLANIKSRLSIREVPFSVSKDSSVYFRNKIGEHSNNEYAMWVKEFNSTYTHAPDKVKKILEALISGKINIDFDISKLSINNTYIDELRNSNNQIMNIISDRSPLFLGGSADLSSSCKTYINSSANNDSKNPTGKNINFGVREHAMGAIISGMATYGLKTFASTFLTFSDYLKPSIRLSALMNVPTVYIFTHDSISIGEDGATHQPIEQLGSLRQIPNLAVYRPADIKEVIGSWNCILKTKNPSALIISKQKVEALEKTSAEDVIKGGYVVRKEIAKLDGIILSTGTETNTAVKIANELFINGLDIRVISIPCLELFELQPESYKQALLPIGAKTIAIEASNDPIWHKYTYSEKMVLNISDFGYSGKSIDVLKKFGFDYNSLKEKVEKLLK